jgi:hypothetical protein
VRSQRSSGTVTFSSDVIDHTGGTPRTGAWPTTVTGLTRASRARANAKKNSSAPPWSTRHRWNTDKFVTSRLYTSNLNKYRNKSVTDIAAGILGIPIELRRDWKGEHCVIRALAGEKCEDEVEALKLVLDDAGCDILEDRDESSWFTMPQLSIVFLHRARESEMLANVTALIDRQRYVAFFLFGDGEQIEAFFPGGTRARLL